ncbi:MAG: HNH endonuclease [Chloroflexi bacterium]|nr:HNH endonuclease [Chloroflexota bacterium]MBP8058348.1 HNH endonuclease [Chloroflexota bacterium]
MSIPTETRKAIREAFGYCCGYCGVAEIHVGSELEVDHFRPLTHGGTNDLDNLIYACSACNRFKADYWPEEDDPDSFYLLHPAEDEMSNHLTLVNDGHFVGLTPRGWFHIQWLHLNRPQLISWRLTQQKEATLLAIVEQGEITRHRLQIRIRELEREVAELQEVIARLL